MSVQLRRGLHIADTILCDFPETSGLKQRRKVESGNPFGFGTLDAEALAVEIEVEFSEGAVEGELLEQVTMLAVAIAVGKKVARWFNSQQCRAQHDKRTIE